MLLWSQFYASHGRDSPTLGHGDSDGTETQIGRLGVDEGKWPFFLLAFSDYANFWSFIGVRIDWLGGEGGSGLPQNSPVPILII